MQKALAAAIERGMAVEVARCHIALGECADTPQQAAEHRQAALQLCQDLELAVELGVLQRVV